jgi:hypothetical protein
MELHQRGVEPKDPPHPFTDTKYELTLEGWNAAVIVDVDVRGVDPSCVDVHKRGGPVITDADMRVDTRKVDSLCHDVHKWL